MSLGYGPILTRVEVHEDTKYVNITGVFEFNFSFLHTVHLLRATPGLCTTNLETTLIRIGLLQKQPLNDHTFSYNLQLPR